MKSVDCLQRFMFENADIRGEIVHLDESYRNIIAQHHYPPEISKLLGEALVAVVLLGASIKFRGQITLQFQSDGPVKVLVVKCNDQMHIRGLVQMKHDAFVRSSNQLLGDGKLVVTVEYDSKVKPYQSIIPIFNDSIADSLECYFAQSEQLPTRMWLAVGEEQAAGMLLQLLPRQTTAARENFWQHATKLGETVTADELLKLESDLLLHRLFHEETIRLYDAQPVQFKCSCNIQRMRNAIHLLGEEEAMDILRSKPQIVVTCEYCNYSYNFDQTAVADIFCELVS